jgi:hypothetical protein
MLNSASQWIPIATFLLGWGSGVITAWAMYRDHDRRLENVEKVVAHLAETAQKNTQDIAVLYQKLRDSVA